MAAHLLPPPAAPGPAVLPFVQLADPLIALTHVRIIDGTGAAPLPDRTILISDGKIAAIQPASARLPEGVRVVDLAGKSVMPGIVGMHDHLFYIARPNLDASVASDEPLMLPQMAFSSPRLYLAGGVTTLRTAGSVEPYTDINLKRLIDTGALRGPHIDVTGPYIDGGNSDLVQFHRLRGADDARRMVNFWPDAGATSSRAELAATVDEALDYFFVRACGTARDVRQSLGA